MNKILILAAICFFSFRATAQDKELRRLFYEGDYFKLNYALERLHSKTDRQSQLYYGAITDNAYNRNEAAIKKIDSFLQQKTRTWADSDIAQLLEVKMDCYSKLYRYKEALNTCQTILSDYDKAIDAADKASIQNVSKIWEALQNTPPQTITQDADALLPVKKGIIGLAEIPVKHDGGEDYFIFDTGANISTISERFAQKLGVRRLDVSFDVTASHGKSVKSGLGVADSLIIGSMVVRNVVFIIMPDKQLDFPQAGFSINGILGFPVISAMKEIHLTQKGELKVPLVRTHNSSGNFCLRGLFPVIQVFTDKDTLSFQFDTGADHTDIFSNYFEQHKKEIIAKSNKTKKKYGGAGGAKTMKVYELPDFRFRTGNDTVTLPVVTVLTTSVKKSDIEFAHGNMGQDVIKQFNEMIINFESMYIDFRN